MYILYLDDAGSVNNAADKHIVLAGIALFERQVHFLQTQLDQLASQIFPADPGSIEFHASHMQVGRKFWRKLPLDQRRRHLADGLAVIDKVQGHKALFGAVIEKAAVSPNDALEYAFEQICSRFDQFLERGNSRRVNKNQKSQIQRGLVIFDRSTRETRLQNLTRKFKRDGHTWGKLRNFVDVPFFVDSDATRAIQYADMVAYALWRNFEKGDDAYFKVIETAFDAEGGVRHGLHIKKL